MWIISVIILFIFLCLKDSSDTTYKENSSWMLQGKERMEELVRKGIDFSDEYVEKMHKRFGYEYDPWYPAWKEKGIITYKCTGPGCWVKLETEKEIEYWTQKTKLSYDDFCKWAEKLWKGKFHFCFEKMTLVRVEDCPISHRYPNERITYGEISLSKYAAEFLLDKK